MTDGMTGVNARVRLSPDLAVWQDISGSSNQVTSTERRRMSGEAYTFRGDTAILTYGRREPIETTIRVLYAEAELEAWRHVRGFFEAVRGNPLYLRWSVGAHWITTSLAMVNRFSYPTADAADAAPILIEIGLYSAAGILPARERWAEACGDALVGYWQLAETEGDVAQDSGRGGMHGQHQDVLLAQAGPVGFSAEYDGETSATVLPTNLLRGRFNSAQGSLSIWLKADTYHVWYDGVTRHIVRICAGEGNRLFIRKGEQDETIEVGLTVGGQSMIGYVETAPMDWTHILLTWDADEGLVAVYMNGALCAEVRGEWSAWDSPLTFASIGGIPEQEGHSWLGRLAGCVLCDKVLSSGQISELVLTD